MDGYGTLGKHGLLPRIGRKTCRKPFVSLKKTDVGTKKQTVPWPGVAGYIHIAWSNSMDGKFIFEWANIMISK